MQIGVAMVISSKSMDVAVLAKRAEELGFESLWLPEHPIIPVTSTSKYGGTPDGSIPPFMMDMADPFISLARASAVTERIKLGTSICLVPEHNPIHQAKQIATLDRLSNGRFIFGIGAGWLREETEIMGGDFDHRWGQTREAILAMKELWAKDESEFHWKFFDFPPVRCFPKPVQTPHPPVFLGGDATNVFKRVVAWGDGWMPVRSDVEKVHRGRATMDELAEAAGRDPSSIQISVYAAPQDRDEIMAYEEVGANRAIVNLSTTLEGEGLDALQEVAKKVFS